MLLGFSSYSGAEALQDRYDLRVFGPVSAKEVTDEGSQGHYRHVRLIAQDAASAKIVYSKILSDFTTLPTIKTVALADQGGLPTLAFEGGRRMLPVLRKGGATVDVYLFESPDELRSFISSKPAATKGAEILTGRQHPFYLDFWDRHCIGFWYTLMRDKGFTDDDDFDFFRKHELSVNTVGGYSAIAARCDRDDLGFKINRWSDVSNYAYDSHPEAATAGDPDTTFKNIYYGDVPFAETPIEKAQMADLQAFLRQFGHDEHFVSITDPHGETGPSDDCFLGQAERGEYSRLDLIHYLRDLRKLSLREVGDRWYGDPGRFKSWNDIVFPRERNFYGWTDGGQDLTGAWKVRMIDRAEGETQQVYQPTFDDSTWFSFQQPGMQELSERVGGAGGAWLRFGFSADAALLKGGKTIYLTACPWANAPYKNPSTIYLNGQKLADLTFGHGSEWGQMDVSSLLKPTGNVVAIYSPEGSVRGPVFLSTRKAEPFPTSDIHLNAQLYDVREWVTDCVARSNARAIAYIRGVDAVRPVKMMAFYAMIDVMMPYLQQYGGYPHCTGEGDYFRPWFKRFGYLRGIPDSSEPSAPAKNMHSLRRIFFTMTMEGMNAHDYFLHLHDITRNPEMKAWYEANVDYFKLLGRFDLKKPDIAVARSWRVDRVTIPGPNAPGDTGYQNDIGRGDIQQSHFSFVYTSEVELRDHLLGNYRIIIDDNFHTLNPEDVANLDAWVKAGGTLVLNQRSGRNTYAQANVWPMADLTGCRETPRPQEGNIHFESNPAILKAYAGQSFPNQGNVLDWQKHPYYSDCVAIEPTAPDVSVIAHYDDGKAAIVMRPVGKGRVVLLGSSFYRNSSDLGGKGYYVGTHDQAVFYKNLLTDLGAASVVDSDQDTLWSEQFIANNGSTQLLVLGNQSDTDTLQNGTATWNLGFTPKRVFDPVTGSDLPVKIDGTKVTISGLTLVPYEMRYYAVERSQEDAVEALAHWLFRQTQLWGAIKPGKDAEVADQSWPVQDFGLWSVKQFDSEDAARKALLADSIDSSWPTLRKGDWASEGLRKDPHLWAVYQKMLKIDSGWLRNLRGVEVLWSQGYHTDAAFAINGQPVGDHGMYDHEKILAALHPGNNLVSVLCGAKPDGNGGMIADFQLCPIPGAGAKTMDLASGWTVYPTDNSTQSITLPAKGSWLMARQSVNIPASYRNCQVWIEAPGASQVSTNGRLRYNSNNYGARYHRATLLVNITPDIRFGQDNELALGSGNWGNGIKAGPMTLPSVTLLFSTNRIRASER